MVGEQHTVQSTVDEACLACTVGSGDLRVYATPMMAALMEQAASELLGRFLEDGKTSVGTALSIEHLAATPLGMQVRATAEITASNGRKVEFAVTAQDETGIIGQGTHTRFIVESQKFQSKADSKSVSTQ